MIFAMSLWNPRIAVNILSSCGRFPALMVSVLIAGIDGDCRVSNDCRGFGRLDFVCYYFYGKGNFRKLSKHMINMIKDNDSTTYKSCHIEGTMHCISCQEARLFLLICS